MSTPTAHEIRQLFLDFFQREGHTIVRSSPLVPPDPTLLFTNAGMVQFKDVFTGRQAASYTRAASSQKCVRAGGKHNDLDNVGRTARHHTFFEMLGNFSFGDYFKEDAIRLAHQLLIRELGLQKDRLMFTVFRGEGEIPADDEARRLWQRIAEVPESRVLGLGKKDNFWMMGDVGPQGPCSEIHFHQGDDLPCDEERAGNRCLGPACDCDRWLEIWNLVFMQFERKTKDSPLTPLPAPSIDTGAGLERMASVIQGRRSNYDTDLFQPLLQTVAQAVGKPYRHSDSDDDVSMRVLGDHCRATAFLIADGVLPSNLSRGYVLRSIMRRAIRHAVRLGLPEGFFATLCLHVTELMGGIFPELHTARSLIHKAVDAEDQGFRATIHRGLKLIEGTTEWISAPGGRVMPGAVAFQLHDTYGFPLDLTQVIGREQGFAVDEAGFAEEMRKQRERSKFAGSGAEVAGDVWKALRGEVGPTAFTGYGRADGGYGVGTVQALVVGGAQVTEALAGTEVDVLIDRTPFYGRSGGQTGDTGVLAGGATGQVLLSRRTGGAEAAEVLGAARAADGDDAVLEVTDTLKPLSDLVVHRARVLRGAVRPGDSVVLLVDEARRDRTRKNHSATHLLHHALRHVLGEHVTQKGSYVGPDKLTFDFSHFAPLTAEERGRVEELVNAAIQRNVDREGEEVEFEAARALGALALFGEKYGDRVRYVRLGESVELCGGTHVFRTGDIGLFKLVAETGIAKGVRRIEAVTGPAARELFGQLEAELGRAGDLLRAQPLEVAARVEKLLDEVKARDKEIAALKQKLLQGAGAGLYSEVRDVSGAKVLVRNVGEVDPKALREAAESALDREGVAVVIMGGTADGKVAVVVAVHKDQVKQGRYHAGKLVGALAPALGGRGGGRPELAQAGGTQPDKLDEALRGSFALLETPAS